MIGRDEVRVFVVVLAAILAADVILTVARRFLPPWRVQAQPEQQQAGRYGYGWS